MPDGVVQWFDAGAGEAAVVKAGRVFRADVKELEPSARHPGARVHFDIRRDVGVDRAVHVTLRPGDRVARHHHRVGTVTGSRRSDAWGLGEAPPPEPTAAGLETPAGPAPLVFVVQGEVVGDARSYATEHLGGLLEHIREPVLFARVKLTQAPDPARDRPAIAEIAVDVDGELVRAHVSGHEMREAIDLLRDRLRDKLEHRSQRREERRQRPGTRQPGVWRHGDPVTPRPDYFDRPVDEREVLRHKSYVVDDMTPDEAAFDMDQLDFDFYLFRDLATGDDSLLERTADGSYRLTRLHPASIDPGPTAISLDVTRQAAPQLTVEEAIERLGMGDDRFVFFANRATGRGCIAYRRYDGHYGLIAPE